MAEAGTEPYPRDDVPSSLLLSATIKALHEWRERRRVPESVTTEELADAGEMAKIMLEHVDASNAPRSVRSATEKGGMEFSAPDPVDDDGVEPEELEALRAEIRARRETLPAGPL